MLAVDRTSKGVHLTGWTQDKKSFIAFKRDKMFDIECSLYAIWLDRLEERRAGWQDPCLPKMQEGAWCFSDAKFDDLDDDDLDDYLD